MKHLFVILHIIFIGSLAAISTTAYADIKWTSRMVFKMLDDECREKIRTHLKNFKNVKGGDHHGRGEGINNVHDYLKDQARGIEKDCGIVFITRPGSAKPGIRWAPDSFMLEIDWQ